MTLLPSSTAPTDDGSVLLVATTVQQQQQLRPGAPAVANCSAQAAAAVFSSSVHGIKCLPGNQLIVTDPGTASIKAVSCVNCDGGPPQPPSPAPRPRASAAARALKVAGIVAASLVASAAVVAAASVAGRRYFHAALQRAKARYRTRYRATNAASSSSAAGGGVAPGMDSAADAGLLLPALEIHTMDDDSSDAKTTSSLDGCCHLDATQTAGPYAASVDSSGMEVPLLSGHSDGGKDFAGGGGSSGNTPSLLPPAAARRQQPPPSAQQHEGYERLPPG